MCLLFENVCAAKSACECLRQVEHFVNGFLHALPTTSASAIPAAARGAAAAAGASGGASPSQAKRARPSEAAVGDGKPTTVVMSRADICAAGTAFGAAGGLVARAFAAAAAAPPPTATEVDAMYKFRVPAIMPGGGCAVAGGELAPEPFNLATAAYCIEWGPALVGHGMTRRLRALGHVVCDVAVAVGAEWVGVYRAVARPEDGCVWRLARGRRRAMRSWGRGGSVRCLVKEAYVGEPSRAWFPLTREFAAGSNNSRVGLDGVAVVIHVRGARDARTTRAGAVMV